MKDIEVYYSDHKNRFDVYVEVRRNLIQLQCNGFCSHLFDIIYVKFKYKVFNALYLFPELLEHKPNCDLFWFDRKDYQSRVEILDKIIYKMQSDETI